MTNRRFIGSIVAGIALAALVLSLAGCSSSPVTESRKAAARGDWIKAVMTYRKALEAEPENIEYRVNLIDTEQHAADYYYERGMEMLEAEKIDEAVSLFQQGLIAKPGHEKLQIAVAAALGRRQANALALEGERLYQAGRLDDARLQFQRALDIYPGHKGAASELARIDKQLEQENASRLVLSSPEPITLQFRQTPLRAAFEFVAKAFGINLIFDEQVEGTPITLYAKDVSFDQALNLMLTTSKTFYKKVGPNTILIAPDTAEKRGQFEDQVVRTYQLNTIRAKDMVNVLKGVMTPKKIIVNEDLNSLIIRDSEPVLRLADRLIQLNDRKPAETLIAVEILEVNRTKAEKLGLDFGQQTTTQFPTVNAGGFRSAFENSTTTLPNVIFNYFKQDVDAKTLANPRIRVISGKLAKIHIGDRVPLVSATILDATGQTRTTFNYTDIGVRLTVEPVIHLDNNMTLKLGLEVSSLGQNLGTTNQPAYSIGTRNAETYMELRDGETAILGGLIQDTDQRTIVRVAGLGDIPVVGALFRSKSSSVTRTDVLLTITPRILRPWDLAARSSLEFYSGTVNSYSDKPVFPVLDTRRTDTQGLPVIRLGGSPIAEETPASGQPSGTAPQPGALPPPGAPPQPGAGAQVFAFAEPSYTGQVDQEFPVDVQGENLGGGTKGKVEIMFNPEILEFVRGEPGSAAVGGFDAKADTGVLRLSFTMSGKPAGAKSPLARLTLRGRKRGVSYLAFRSPELVNEKGGPSSVQTRASRVVVP